MKMTFSALTGAETGPPACGIREPGACESGDTTHRHNTHSTDSREVCYQWHPWYGRTVWIYESRSGREHLSFRCGLEPTQHSKSLEIPQWMLEAACCSNIRLVEVPRVDCAALRALKTLLRDSVVQGRHHSVTFAGGADGDSHDSTTVCADRSVPFAVECDRMAQATEGCPASDGEVVGETTSRSLQKPAACGAGEGGAG
jgi:hypothetical protein